MLRLRCRSSAVALVVLLALAAAAPPAAAAPIAPGSAPWWSSLASGLDGLLGLFGLGGERRVGAPEGPALDPDGFSDDSDEPAPLPGTDGVSSGPTDGVETDTGGSTDPNGDI